MKKKLISCIALLLAVILPLTVLAEAPTVSTQNPLTFSTTTLYGKKIDSSILKKYDLIMVNFWAEWCGPCVGELPDIQKIYKEYKNVLVLGAYVDENDAGAIAAAEDAGITYPLFRAPYNFYDYLDMASNGSFNIPQTCFFNSKGYQLNSAYVGSRNYEWWKQIVDELLACVEGSGSTSTDPAAEPTQEPGETPTTDPAQEPSEEPTISKPVIKKQPKNLTVKAGKKATFTVKAKGEKLKYQWYYRTSPTAKWKKVTSKGKSATLTFKAKAKQNGWQYRCLVKNSAGQVYTKTVKLKVKKK